MGTYLDAVLDITYKPVFNDTPEKTKAFVEELQHDPMFSDYVVCDGKTLQVMSLQEYLVRN
jgi:hypothetical protein